MAPQLWLLRHAEAEPHGSRPDAERMLTARGERQSRVAGQALQRLGIDFATVLTSPKERARRTAQLVLGQWNPDRSELLQVHEPLAGGFDAGAALAALRQGGEGERVLLIGHEPDLSGVVASLTGARVDLKKGGLAVVRLQAAFAELILLLRPRELELIAEPQS